MGSGSLSAERVMATERRPARLAVRRSAPLGPIGDTDDLSSCAGQPQVVTIDLDLDCAGVTESQGDGLLTAESQRLTRGDEHSLLDGDAVDDHFQPRCLVEGHHDVDGWSWRSRELLVLRLLGCRRVVTILSTQEQHPDEDPDQNYGESEQGRLQSNTASRRHGRFLFDLSRHVARAER